MGLMNIREKLQIDVSAPGKRPKRGSLHPVTVLEREIVRSFAGMGFSVAVGPEVETERYNFDALNIPKDHPARDMWDTFWLKDETPEGERLLLRTHTSPVQIRWMESHTPPIRIIAPGKVFRFEATDATHETQFYQFEGLMIGEQVSLADLKGTLTAFFENLFKKSLAIRFRPSFFPFTEPSVEIDIGCIHCDGKGCGVCKQTGWIEVMGAGMVHPKVLEACGIDSNRFQGFAFGGGVDRFVMLKWGIPDVRMLYTGDLRVVDQFPRL